MRRSILVVMSFATVAGLPTDAADKPDATKAALAEKVAAFAYPGGKLFQEYALGSIAQRVWVTSDDLAKVDEWYRKALGINQALNNGVSEMPWPTGAKAADTKGQQQRSVFQDEVRPKGEDGREMTVRPPTTRSYVSRTPERTVVVVINRGPDDKQTMVSVVVLSAEPGW